MIARFFRRGLLNPLLRLLRQGITPEKLSWSVALGITLGVTPVLGSTSLLCLLAAGLFRLNLPAIQLVNYFAYPLQLVLLIPFLRMGQWLFSAPRLQLSLPWILALIRADAFRAIVTLWSATLHALVAWLAVALPSAPVLYLFLTPVLRRLGQSPGMEAR